MCKGILQTFFLSSSLVIDGKSVYLGVEQQCKSPRICILTHFRSMFFLLLSQPDREDELKRIEEQGGRVINWNGARVFGVLAMSRAIGIFILSIYCVCFF